MQGPPWVVSRFFPHFASKAEFLSYVLLFLVKMPFPPATRPRSFSGAVKKKLLCQSSSSLSPAVCSPDEKSSWNDRLKRLDKKASQLKSKLPTRCVKAGHQLEGTSAWISTPPPAEVLSVSGSSFMESSFDKSASAASSGKSKSSSSKSAAVTSSSLSKDSRSSPASSGSLSSRNEETKGFSVNLAPEAVLLLQKRSREKQLRKAALQRREQPATCGSRPDVPLVKISLLNDNHQYDDVEYEATEQPVDQSVLLKCAEWLRGVEKAAGVGKMVKSSQKCV